ncbi:MAG: adenylate kinase [Methanobrevibacter sp.]|uniref:adenylate kinase n=1 Tax=Methanobrevibacter sp. TaxID=66852 RepID=UPI0026DF5FC2|nr:adenylate kinase [Methanobrevibacter sp.]MDO5848766.1 adenylate kinase [Methanobrevibacter sp.]
MKLVVLTGIPGSGSTTLLNKALEEVEYLHLNYGDIMTEIAIEEKLVENRDELRKLPSETQKIIQQKAAKRIKERSESENVIVDTHCTISTPDGFLPGLPIWVLEKLKPSNFILVEANPDEIIYRRLSDETRSRDVEKAKNIKLHQEMNRAAAMAYATLTGATVKIIENHDNHLPGTVARLVDVLK